MWLESTQNYSILTIEERRVTSGRLITTFAIVTIKVMVVIINVQMGNQFPERQK